MTGNLSYFACINPSMSSILLYILLILCICCLCGMGIVMLRRERGRGMSHDGAYVSAGLRRIISSLDGIISEVGDQRIIARIAQIRSDAEQLLAKIDSNTERESATIDAEIARRVAIADNEQGGAKCADMSEPQCDDAGELPVHDQPSLVPDDETRAPLTGQTDDARRELSPVVEVTGDRLDIFDMLDDPLVEKAVKYVEANIRRPDLSVEQVSAYMDVSRVYLYKKIKTATGLTPIEFIRLIRLRRAAGMLRQGNVTVSEVAGRVGFNSPRNFSKYFRDEFGVLPSAYQSQI